MTSPHDAPSSALHRPVHTQADLEALWRALMEPLGFSGPSLWLLRLGADGTPVPRLTKVEDVADVPGEQELAGFVDTLRHLAGELGGELSDGEVGRWAFLLSRPGRGGARPLDRALAAALVGACRAAGIGTGVVHLATDDTLVPLPYDELATTTSS